MVVEMLSSASSTFSLVSANRESKTSILMSYDFFDSSNQCGISFSASVKVGIFGLVWSGYLWSRCVAMRCDDDDAWWWWWWW